MTLIQLEHNDRAAEAGPFDTLNRGTRHIGCRRWSSGSGGAGAADQLHLIRFHGVLAPNAKLRALVIPAEQGQEVGASGAGTTEPGCGHARPARISWTRLLKRVFELDMAEAVTGGFGRSGIGRLHGIEELNDFLET